MEQIFIDEVQIESVNKETLALFYNNNKFEISFLFKSDFRNSKYLRDYLLIIFDILWIDVIWKNRFVLIVDELNNNAIEYGSKEGSINTLRFQAEKWNDDVYIQIEVQDCGDWKSSKKATEMEILRDERLEKWFLNHKSIRGRGLFLIITKLVDKLYFKDSQEGWLVVGVHKKIEIKKE